MRAQPSAMADAAKKEKIAAAKKKLKQFQQKKTGRTPSSSPGPTGGSKESLNGTNGDSCEQKGLGDRHVAASTKVAAAVSATPNRKTTSQNISIGSPAGDSSTNQSTYSTPIGNLQAQNPRLTATASTEKLQQLSRQINGLIVDSSAYLNNDDSTKNSSIADLETRNRELASLLQKHSQANEQLNKQLQELKSHNSKLQTTVEGERRGFEDRLKRELGSLKEQLQVHIQTIGILVAEKTELQSALNQSTKLAESRLHDLADSAGRLKASRTRVSELERSFTTASSAGHKHEKNSKELGKDVDRLKLELYKINKATEELQQQNSELTGKLKTKSAECGQQEDKVIELRGKLEMAELLVQQLKNSGIETVSNSDEVDKLVTERSQLQAQVEQYEKAFQKLGAEREQIAAQYQDYIEQLQAKNQEVATQSSLLLEERDTMRQQLSRLETALHESQSQQSSEQAVSSESEKEKTELSETLNRLRSEFDVLKTKYDAQVTDNSQLSRFITEKEMKIEELEMTVQRLGDSEVDRDQLLDSMQSDKTALSRAMAQNRELKHQLAELQNGFVKMSNDNMDLMTQLTSEQHVAKELAARLSQQEDELKEVREQLTNRERHLQEVESNTAAAHMERNYTHEQIEDRLRHYEAQAQLVETLQRELTSAQDTINAMTNQNSMLHSRIAGYENGETSNLQGHDNSDLVTSLSTSVQQLEMERNQVLNQLHDEQGLRQASQEKLQQLQHELAHQTPATLNGDVISKAQFEALQHAMNQLEVKYTKTMRDKADLMDKSEQLEHLIMQLQGETDTIGEYVTLYQHQRSMLKQRQVEKDDYIARLSREREDMQDKVGQLQALVMQLLGEKQMLHSYQENQELIGNHVQPEQANKKPASSEGKKRKRFSGKLDSSQLEDWPDYTSSDDSDASEVEAIVGGAATTALPATPTGDQSKDRSAQPASPASTEKWNIPQEDQTAQRIMHLLTEIGNSNLVDATNFSETNFIHCNRCSGRLLSV